MRWVKRLASLRLAAALLCLWMVVLILDAQGIVHGTGLREAVLGALLINLLASLWTYWRAFRKKPPLLLFHLGLLAMVLLGLYGRQVYFIGNLVVSEGHRMTLSEGLEEAGPWVSQALLDTQIGLDRVDTSYWHGDNTRDSSARIAILEPGLPAFRALVLPGQPARYRGLRVYLSPVHGYSAVFSVVGGPQESSGLLVFPDYRRNAGVAQPLIVPGRELALQVTLEGLPIPDPDGPWEMSVPEAARARMTGDYEALLEVGESVSLGVERLRFDGVRRYASLNLSSDPTEDPIIMVLFLQGMVMGWYFLFAKRRRRQPGKE